MTTQPHQHEDFEKRLQQVEAFVQEKRAIEAQQKEREEHAAKARKEQEEIERHNKPIQQKMDVIDALMGSDARTREWIHCRCTTIDDVKKLHIRDKERIEDVLQAHGVIKTLEQEETGDLHGIYWKYKPQLKK